PVSLPAPDGIEFEVPQPTEIVVRGIDKQLVGETAARVRKSRPPEPYMRHPTRRRSSPDQPTDAHRSLTPPTLQGRGI
ncbi:MAG: 50S ribosomal protein L6, partial [Solirubrobacterales bacterium]